MLFRIIVLANIAAALAETVTSIRTVDQITYNCPDRQTIETAYYDYCPSTSRGGSRDLDGIDAVTYYPTAPTSYATETNSFELVCGYANPNDDTDTIDCHYSAGNGASIGLDPNFGEQDGDCPTLSAVVPQPSGGGTYRRSYEKRATLGARPQFVCPFDSDDNTQSYVGSIQTDAGRFADANADSVGGTSDELLIACGLPIPDTMCYYSQTGNTVELTAHTGDNRDLCPSNLCTAIYSNSGVMRRGVYIEPSPMRGRQVKTSDLRSRVKRRL